MNSTRKYVSEFSGTFGLVFCGTGAIVINETYNNTIGHIGIAITFGLIVIAMIYSFGEISGAHINPAVTIGFWFAGRFPGKDVLPYIVSQVAGAFFASILIKFLFPLNINLGATMPAGPPFQSFILEIILSYLLMLTIINASTGAKEKGITAGIAIGSVVLLEAMFAGPVSGASMNPARSIAPAVLSGNFQNLWIYIFAPVIGAFLAVLMCRIIRGKDCCPFPKF